MFLFSRPRGRLAGVSASVSTASTDASLALVGADVLGDRLRVAYLVDASAADTCGTGGGSVVTCSGEATLAGSSMIGAVGPSSSMGTTLLRGFPRARLAGPWPGVVGAPAAAPGGGRGATERSRFRELLVVEEVGAGLGGTGAGTGGARMCAQRLRLHEASLSSCGVESARKRARFKSICIQRYCQ